MTEHKESKEPEDKRYQPTRVRIDLWQQIKKEALQMSLKDLNTTVSATTRLQQIIEDYFKNKKAKG